MDRFNVFVCAQVVYVLVVYPSNNTIGCVGMYWFLLVDKCHIMERYIVLECVSPRSFP